MSKGLVVISPRRQIAGVISRRDNNRIGRLFGRSKGKGMGFSLIAFKKSRRRKRLCGIVLF